MISPRRRLLSTSIRSVSFIAFVMVGLAGCTTVHDQFRPYTQQQLSPVPLNAAIVLPDSLCSLYYDNRNLTAFDLGPVICKNARIAAESTFTVTNFYSDTDTIEPGESDVIGILSPGTVRTKMTRVIPVTTYADVDLNWEFRSNDGNRRYRSTVRGRGNDQRTFGRADPRYAAAMQHCMDDLASNLQREMVNANGKARRNMEATRRLLAWVDDLSIGKTSYSEYRSAKTDTSHVYAVDERLSHQGRRYSYVSDPESNRHDFTMGNCTTRWPKPWPVIEALRPSLYLSGTGIDMDELSGFYVKEIIGSAYDNHPLCETVFEGDNAETALLTHRSCAMDYSARGGYQSPRQQSTSGLSETAQQWLKLRVGMTKPEINELIGVPSEIVVSTLLKGQLFEYGHGRIRLDDAERLIYWQLRELPSALDRPTDSYAHPASTVMRYKVVGSPGLGFRQSVPTCLPN